MRKVAINNNSFGHEKQYIDACKLVFIKPYGYVDVSSHHYPAKYMAWILGWFHIYQLSKMLYFHVKYIVTYKNKIILKQKKCFYFTLFCFLWGTHSTFTQDLFCFNYIVMLLKKVSCFIETCKMSKLLISSHNLSNYPAVV